MIITACEFNQALNDRLQDGKHHMTQPDSLLNMAKQKVTRSPARSRFMQWKEATFQHVTPLSGWRAEPAATERGEFTRLTFPALSPPGCDALLLLLNWGLRKVHHGNRGIWWREAFCEVARADITHPIMQSNQQLPLGNKHATFYGLLTWTEASRSHSCDESVSWASKLVRYCNFTFLGTENKNRLVLLPVKLKPYTLLAGVSFFQEQWNVSCCGCGWGRWVWTRAASDSPARGPLISQSGECNGMTSLMTDSLNGYFLHICHTKRQVPAWPSGLQGGLIESYVMICRNVSTNTLLLLVSMNAQSLITLQQGNPWSRSVGYMKKHTRYFII